METGISYHYIFDELFILWLERLRWEDLVAIKIRWLVCKRGIGKNRAECAPVAQWIERCPPEADAGVRVAAWVQDSEEPLENALERFFAVIGVVRRAKLMNCPTSFKYRSNWVYLGV